MNVYSFDEALQQTYSKYEGEPENDLRVHEQGEGVSPTWQMIIKFTKGAPF